MDADRARASLFGLALGDAFGRPLAFVRGPRARTRPVVVPSADFVWTHDTHMTLFVAEAVIASHVGQVPLSDDDLGRAIGRAMVLWSRDPRTPSTAPDHTCLQSAATFAATGDWRQSGVPHRDGSGPILRVAPLAMRLSGAPLAAAARVQAMVTHGHPNAAAAAIATCLLLRELYEGAPLVPTTVVRTLRRLMALGVATEAVSGALMAAVSEAAGPSLAWLDGTAIPDGDGGWRAPSALCLALVTALRCGDDFALAVEKASRFDGDSDNLAALTGMLLGAGGGMAALPSPWLSALPDRAHIGHVLDGLLPPSAPTPRNVASVRTSATDPIEVAWIPGEFGPRGGRLGLTFAPGKHAPSTLGTAWARDLQADLQRLHEGHGVQVLVSLVTDAELSWLQIPDLVVRAEAKGIAVIRHPVEDGGIPDVAEALRTVATALSLARAGQRVVFHCRGGLGRAGTFTALTLRLAGLAPEAAMSLVRSVRPGAIENAVQEDFLRLSLPE